MTETTPSTVQNILFFVIWPVSQHDAGRYGFALLEARGFSVKVIDLCALHSPQPRDSYAVPSPWTGSGLLVMETMPQFQQTLATLRATSVGVLLLNMTVATEPIFHALAHQAFRTITLECGMLPEPFGIEAPWWMRLRHHIATWRRPRSWRANIRTWRRARWLRQYPPERVLVGGMAALTRLEGQYGPAIRSHVVPAHALDYDQYLRLRSTAPATPGNQVVFLDTFEPHHPDWATLGVVPPTPEPYYASIRRFLDVAEARLALPCVIAAHPRSDYTPADPRFDGRPVWRGRTAELVRDARVVISHNSTSTNFAILFRKPLVFILTTEQLRSWTGLHTRSFSRLLGHTVLNIDDDGALQSYPWQRLHEPVDEARYQHYQDTYIVHPDSPPLPLWDIFADVVSDLSAPPPAPAP